MKGRWRAVDDYFMSTEKHLRKPQGGEIDVEIGIPAIKLRIEIGQTDGWSRIQVVSIG